MVGEERGGLAAGEECCDAIARRQPYRGLHPAEHGHDPLQMVNLGEDTYGAVGTHFVLVCQGPGPPGRDGSGGHMHPGQCLAPVLLFYILFI